MKYIDSFYELVNDYHGFLFDAYGVLVNESGLLPGAKLVLEHLQVQAKPFLMLTNGSSRTVADTAKRYSDLGLPFSSQNLISSGGLLAEALDRTTDPDETVIVLGTSGSRALVKDAGRRPLSLLEADKVKVRTFVIANQTDFDFLPTVDCLLSLLIAAVDRGDKVQVILTNPDLFYPQGQDKYGITAGSISLIIEQCLKVRFGAVPPIFTKLGKPFRPMFAEAKKRLGSDQLLMIGDQLGTDILGANNNGLDSLLLGTGLTKLATVQNQDKMYWPSYLCQNLLRS